MKASKFILVISIPCFLIAVGMDLYFGQGVIMSPAIIGDVLWFSIIPMGLFFCARASERDEGRKESEIV